MCILKLYGSTLTKKQKVENNVSHAWLSVCQRKTCFFGAPCLELNALLPAKTEQSDNTPSAMVSLIQRSLETQILEQTSTKFLPLPPATQDLSKMPVPAILLHGTTSLQPQACFPKNKRYSTPVVSNLDTLQ